MIIYFLFWDKKYTKQVLIFLTNRLDGELYLA